MAKPNRTVAKFVHRMKHAPKTTGEWVNVFTGDRETAWKTERKTKEKGFRVKVTRFRVGSNKEHRYNFRVWKWVNF